MVNGLHNGGKTNVMIKVAGCRLWIPSLQRRVILVLRAVVLRSGVIFLAYFQVPFAVKVITNAVLFFLRPILLIFTRRDFLLQVVLF